MNFVVAKRLPFFAWRSFAKGIATAQSMPTIKAIQIIYLGACGNFSTGNLIQPAMGSARRTIIIVAAILTASTAVKIRL